MTHRLRVATRVDFQRADVEYDAEFVCWVDDFCWVLTASHVNWGRELLGHCGHALHEPNDVRKNPFCGSDYRSQGCYTDFPTLRDKKIVGYSLWNTGDLTRPMLEDFFDPLTAELIAEDIQGITMAVYFGWEKGFREDRSLSKLPYGQRESNYSRVQRVHRAAIEGLEDTQFELGDWAKTFTYPPHYRPER